MTQENTDVRNMTFEEAMKALEELVKRLEAGGIDLDESLGIYERAVELRNHCKAILDDGKRRIQRIMETSEGVKLDDFSE